MPSLETVILDILEAKQPRNVKELVSLVQEQSDSTLEDIKKEIRILHRKGLVMLEDPASQPTNLIDFLSLKSSRWFWIAVATTVLSFLSILLIPETGTPLSYVRYIFAFILVVFLPGYCLTETLFPKDDALDMIERITFSIGLSFAVTALVGLFLSFSSLNLTLATALPALGSLVLVSAVVALFRKYRLQ